MGASGRQIVDGLFDLCGSWDRLPCKELVELAAVVGRRGDSTQAARTG